MTMLLLWFSLAPIDCSRKALIVKGELWPWNGMFLCAWSLLLRRPLFPLLSPILSTDTHNVLNAMIPWAAV